MAYMSDETMTAAEFDALAAAGTPVDVNVRLERPWHRELFNVTFTTAMGVAVGGEQDARVHSLSNWSGTGNLLPA